MIYRLRAFGRKLPVETLPEKYSPSKEENIDNEQSTNAEKEVPPDYAYWKIEKNSREL